MITKSYDPKSGHCLATFTCHPPAQAKHVSLCGDFNQWEPGAHPMKRGPEGTYSITTALPPASRFAFKYLADSGGWLNDNQADDYQQNEYGEWNSILTTPPAPPHSGPKKTPAKKSARKTAPEKPTTATKKIPAKKAPAKKKAASKKSKTKEGS